MYSRCSRCYGCPVCTSPLSLKGLGVGSRAAASKSPYFLACDYCEWSTLHLNITLNSPKDVHDQLLKARIATTSRADIFADLVSFYQDQTATEDVSYTYQSSPEVARVASTLQRYGNSPNVLRPRGKPKLMREANQPVEGQVLSAANESRDQQVVDKLRQSSFNQITTLSQRSSHPWNHQAQFVSQLWPVPTQLAKTTSKRCRNCRHILTKLDDRSSTRKYKIRLLAKERIPGLSIRLLNCPTSIGTPSFALERALSVAARTAAKDSEKAYHLKPHKPVQYLLTLVNPLFEPVRISLATPATVPGPTASRVTILCPSFEIGAKSEMWDDALATTSSASTTSMASSLSSSHNRLNIAASSLPDSDARQPEAGKIWEKDRNWVRVVLEVVPGAAMPMVAAAKEPDTRPEGLTPAALEIPIHVRVEWEAEPSGVAVSTGSSSTKEKRQIAFWSVLGVGQIVS